MVTGLVVICMDPNRRTMALSNRDVTRVSTYHQRGRAIGCNFHIHHVLSDRVHQNLLPDLVGGRYGIAYHAGTGVPAPITVTLPLTELTRSSAPPPLIFPCQPPKP